MVAEMYTRHLRQRGYGCREGELFVWNGKIVVLCCCGRGGRCVLSQDVLRLWRGSRDGLWRGRDGEDGVWRLRRCEGRRTGGSQSQRSRHQSRNLPSTAKYSVSEDGRRVRERLLTMIMVVVEGRNGMAMVFWFLTRGHHVWFSTKL